MAVRGVCEDRGRADQGQRATFDAIRFEGVLLRAARHPLCHLHAGHNAAHPAYRRGAGQRHGAAGQPNAHRANGDREQSDEQEEATYDRRMFHAHELTHCRGDLKVGHINVWRAGSSSHHARHFRSRMRALEMWIPGRLTSVEVYIKSELVNDEWCRLPLLTCTL